VKLTPAGGTRPVKEIVEEGWRFRIRLNIVFEQPRAENGVKIKRADRPGCSRGTRRATRGSPMGWNLQSVRG